MITGAVAAVVGECELRYLDLPELHHLVEFFGEDLEKGPTPLPAADVGVDCEDVVENPIDAISIGA